MLPSPWLVSAVAALAQPTRLVSRETEPFRLLHLLHDLHPIKEFLIIVNGKLHVIIYGQ